MDSYEDNLVKWAKEFYDLLDSEAEGEAGERVFVGQITEVFKRLDVGVGNYSPIRAILVSSGAVQFQKRGNRRESTVLSLLGSEKISSEGLTRARRDATVSLQGVKQRLRSLEAWRETTGGVNLSEVLRDFERRISALENGSNRILADGEDNTKSNDNRKGSET
ncbi:MAG TPA: hypothetical protein VGE97_07310 [Nitrososphaera sp.]|jgi:hypothetical protein